MSESKHRRIAVIGLDGLSPDYLETVIHRGHMPFYKHIYDKSIIKKLDCMPPLTPPSWSSIMSGVNPGKHGIFDFIKLTYNGTWKARFYNALDLKHPRIHEMAHLSRSNIRSLILNPIPDTPIIPVRNSVIASLSFFTPKPRIYPSESMKYISNDIIEFFEKYLSRKKLTKDCSVIDEHIDVMEYYVNIINEFTNKDDFNLIWVNINIPDHIFHSCSEAIIKPDMLGKIFNNIDKLLKILYNYSGELVVVSDHGFKYYKYQINVNEILRREGFLKESGTDFNIGDPFGDGQNASTSVKVKSIKLPKQLYLIIKKYPIINSIGRKILKILSKSSNVRIKINTGMGIDYTRSKAFLPVTKGQDTSRYYVYLNDINILDNVYNVLSKYGLEVYKSRDVFIGPHVSEAPPLIVLGDEDTTIAAHGPNGMVKYNANRGNHARFGVMAAYLDDIDLGLNKDIEDIIPNMVVAPIIMCRLDIPLSIETDHINIVKKLCNRYSIKTYNYRSKWNVYLSIVSRGMRKI